MVRRALLLSWSGLVVLVLGVAVADPGGPPPETSGPGKSSHGPAFNEGPRQAAVRLEGTGRVSFPVTTTSSQAQAFFNQGVGQLHGYWFVEAERSFRQAAALDPNCVMAYWGMAVANLDNDARASEFIKQAVKRKADVSRREQEWIQALADYFALPGGDDKERRRSLVQAQERICYRYPDDLEAKAFLVWFLWENNVNGIPIDSKYAVNAVVDQILSVEPLHPVHHFRIHLNAASEEASRSRLLASAAKCGPIAPDVPHMWHMPSQPYTDLQRFADAAFHQEAALRIENAHLTRMKMMPGNEALYQHNRGELIETLSHVGRVRDALQLALSVVESPRHPKFGPAAGAEGRRKLLDLSTRHELWDELLKLETSDAFEPTTDRTESVQRALAFGQAHFARGNGEKGGAYLTRLGDLKKQDPSDKIADRAYTELLGHQALAAGNVNAALTWFEKAEFANKDMLSRLCLQAKDPVRANAMSHDVGGRVQRLACRVEVLHALNRKDEARKAFDQLRRLGERADLSLPVLSRLQPIAREFGYPDDWRQPATPAPDVGDRPNLDAMGPLFWQPWTAPDWTLTDIDGGRRTLKEFAGRPVIVICYLGVGCIHCVQQLQEFNKAAEKFAAEKIAIVAVGTDPVELMRRSRDNVDPDAKLPLVMLSDVKHDVFRAYGAFDDFEGKPLHGTFLIDGSGRVRWQDVGADPFTDTEFLLGESRRLLRQSEARLGYGPGGSNPVKLKPLTEMTAQDRYKGHDGGLYGAGRNTPPDDLLRRALEESKRITPTAQGRVVLLGLGGGQAGEVFGRFKAMADADADKSRDVVLVDGTQWGQETAAWADPKNAPAWATVARRLQSSGTTAEQVRAVWLHVAGGTKEDLARIVNGLRERYPNLRLVWLSSAIFAGHTVRGEPAAYETAFTVRSAIQDQGQGPVLLWGPYLWSAGATPRQDGLAWKREDFLADGVDLSAAGRDKAAGWLLRWLKEDSTARAWFLRRP